MIYNLDSFETSPVGKHTEDTHIAEIHIARMSRCEITLFHIGVVNPFLLPVSVTLQKVQSVG